MRSFAAKVLLDLHDSSLLAAQRGQTQPTELNHGFRGFHGFKTLHPRRPRNGNGTEANEGNKEGFLLRSLVFKRNECLSSALQKAVFMIIPVTIIPLTSIRAFHQSSPESVHFPRFALFSLAFLMDLAEIINH